MKKQSAKYSKTEPSARRSNKSPTSPSGNPKPEDMLTQSQVNQELLKTQQSFRSSTGHQGQTPSISSKVTQSVTSPGRNMQKRPSQIISKQQLQNMHERSVIKVLGMNMEAVCPKKNHEKNKMLYICQYGDCKADNRLGCSYCLVESHNDHSQQVMEVQTFCKIFDDRKKQFKNLSDTILQVPDKTAQVSLFFEQLRDQIMDRLKQIEKNILQSIQEQLAWKPLQKEILYRVEVLSSKLIFDMTQDELKESLEFIQGKHFKELEYIKQETNNYLSQKIALVEHIWNDYKIQLETDITQQLNDYNKVMFLDPQSKEFAEYKMQFFQQKQLKVNELSQPFHQQLEMLKEEERKVEEKKQEEIRIQQQIEQRKKEEEVKKEKERQKQVQEQILKQKEAQKNSERQSERDKLLKTFPYKLYTEDCQHRTKCNTIPIFSCCNKAYPCSQCHGFVAHPPRIQVPSYRYCMKCLEIYLVMYPTNQAINCLKCQK
ncbi:unnamed protein product (macronuclear) [Paramecium tetraurelia]|uniref:CHY-type domain-containing protein n=1 Tax=Paramecium tetraurelia TaxID=5888 RepID=A0CKX7_PARTE|nr:uncharacterized protein GSPATT00007991001 [Paramecium tetraurelia]CAK71444.1 unnamed protein product [Paramecium tetraurelia]|eukprot:XP_001438841.1 hypothetical protein (macronuclear) [Paramecium tetraurelia strain d4-2]